MGGKKRKLTLRLDVVQQLAICKERKVRSGAVRPLVVYAGGRVGDEVMSG